MRTYLVLAIAGWMPAVALAEPAPLNFPEVEVVVKTATDDACFGAARHLTGDPSSCDVLIQRAEADAPTLAATHNNRGLILGAMGLTEEALADFAAALELAPELAQARVNRANVLFRLARYPEALSAYDAALADMATDQHVALFNRALVHRALGNVEQAAADLAQARRLADASVPGNRF